MSLFRCPKCGCAEDTALCHYWSARLRDTAPDCDPNVGKWRGEFPREPFPLRHKREFERWLGVSIEIIREASSSARQHLRTDEIRCCGNAVALGCVPHSPCSIGQTGSTDFIALRALILTPAPIRHVDFLQCVAELLQQRNDKRHKTKFSERQERQRWCSKTRRQANRSSLNWRSSAPPRAMGSAVLKCPA